MKPGSAQTEMVPARAKLSRMRSGVRSVASAKLS
jgi:hypothetical protein